MDMEHERRLTAVEERSQSNTHRLDDIERRQDNLDDLVSTVKVLAVKEENVEKDVKEIKNDVKTLTSKPGKMMDDITGKIITTVIGIIVGFIFSKIGM